MGTDYYLIDPKARQVLYIDRAGSDFCCVHPGPERQKVPDHGTVRVVTAGVLEAVRESLEDDGPHADLRTKDAYNWCLGRTPVLLVDDHSSGDEVAFAFCGMVSAGEVEGWSAAPDAGTDPRPRSQQERWDSAMFELREAGVDVPRMAIEQAMRNYVRLGLGKDERKAADEAIPHRMSAEGMKLQYELDVRDFDAGVADTAHTVLVLRSKDPGHGFHQPVYGAVFQEEWNGEDDPEAQGVRIGYGRDVLSAIQDLLGSESAEVDEGDLPGRTTGAELPREVILEAALADAYGRIEQLLEERRPLLDQANALVLSMEQREAIGEDWHPYYDQWLRTFAEWCARMGPEYWGHRDAAHLVRSLFAKLSGFEPQESPEPRPLFYPTIRGGEPERDQERPQTSELEKDPDPQNAYWAQRRESVEAGPPEWRQRRPPRTTRDRSVTHEVVTRFNVETGYVEWRGYRILLGALEPLDQPLLQSNGHLLEGVMLLHEVWEDIAEKFMLGVPPEKSLADILTGDITERVRAYLDRIPRVTEDDLADSHGGPELGSPAPHKLWTGEDDG